MADLNRDGYDDLTGQQNPVVDARVANSLPRGAAGSVLTNDSSRVSPKVNVAWYNRTPAQTAAWKSANFNTNIPVSQGTLNNLSAAGGKAGAISKYGLSQNPETQEALSRMYGFTSTGMPVAPRLSPNQFGKVNPVNYRPASWSPSGVMGGRTTYASGAQRYAGMAGSTTRDFVDPTSHSITSDPETIRENISANRVSGPSFTLSQETTREDFGPKTTNSATLTPSVGTSTTPAVSAPRTGPVYAPAGGGLPKPSLPQVQTPIAPYKNTERGD